MSHEKTEGSFLISPYSDVAACVGTKPFTGEDGQPMIEVTQADHTGTPVEGSATLRFTMEEWRAHVRGILGGETLYGTVQIITPAEYRTVEIEG